MTLAEFVGDSFLQAKSSRIIPSGSLPQVRNNDRQPPHQADARSCLPRGNHIMHSPAPRRQRRTADSTENVLRCENLVAPTVAMEQSLVDSCCDKTSRSPLRCNAFFSSLPNGAMASHTMAPSLGFLVNRHGQTTLQSEWTTDVLVILRQTSKRLDMAGFSKYRLNRPHYRIEPREDLDVTFIPLSVVSFIGRASFSGPGRDAPCQQLRQARTTRRVGTALSPPGARLREVLSRPA